MKNIVFMFLACVLLFGTSCHDKTARTELDAFKLKQNIEEQNKQIIQRYWDGKWNERHAEILEELQSPHVVYHGTSMEMNGLEEYKEVYQSYLSAMHDSHLTINQLIAEDDWVMSRVRLEAVHKGDMEGLPATGKKVEVDIFTVFRLVDGKIVEEWEVMDELGMMMQLGLELQMKEEINE
ncbi:ester cyclase [uncultured Sunxiuqinia sp.]|uniref:ester cyclase n=1 Tax=uncultured Sunxiuqinia sp. TaxID=1573825 RepID=UPI00260E807D|nr:ester cyclase [uncultured Sunxiuqinia sp.]